jgi:pimeloyl-ACP methyl ester carboxylesterase
MIAWEASGSGRAAVFVHGITEDRHGWDRVVPHLEGAMRCIRLDLRGHGGSSDADDYSAPAMAGDIATVVAEAGVEEAPLVIGHSLGAIVATAYASAFPVRGVVNIDQSLDVAPFAAALQPLAPMLRGDDFATAVQLAFAGLGVELLPPEERVWAERLHAAARQDVVLGVWGILLDSTPAEVTQVIDGMLAGITAPYLALHGGSPGDGYDAWLRARLPSAIVEVWDGDGHYPHLVEPERFAQRILELDASL